MNLKNKFELYFFNPYDSEEEYSQKYFEITGPSADVAYSPLYLLRRHILILSGRIFAYKDLNPPVHHTPYFSAILISNIMITGLVKLMGYGRNYPGFYLKYLGKNEIQLIGLRVLRNSLEHNNFMLFSRLKKDARDRNIRHCFDTLSNYFLINNQLNTEQLNILKHFKVAFNLSEEESREIVSNPRIRIDLENEYALIKFTIRPFKFLQKLEQTVHDIKKEILQDEKLMEKFDTTVTIDNWMHVYKQIVEESRK